MRRKTMMSLAGAVSLIAPLVLTSVTFAWGPERPTYTNEHPADHAVFNSITNNAAVGDERDFVRIEEKNSGRPYTSAIEVEAGKQYEVYIYYHNDASKTYNDSAHNRVGVARDVRLASNFPSKLSAGEEGTVLGKIMASNTDPKEVWDEAFITAKQDMTLHYVEGSARIYNNYAVNGSVLSTNLFSDMGTFIGLSELNGVILGCDEYSGQIVYTIQTVAAGEPVPEPTPDPEKPIEPEIPDELPTTGPVEIVLAIVVVGLIVAGAIYWSKTQKAVKRTAKRAKGKK